MCGRLRLEGLDRVRGDMVPVITSSGIIKEVQWLGHSRIETGVPKNSEEVSVLATEYTEQNIPFSIPKDQMIKAFLVKSPNFPKKEGLFIITRPATKEELKKCKHPRHPLIK